MVVDSDNGHLETIPQATCARHANRDVTTISESIGSIADDPAVIHRSSNDNTGRFLVPSETQPHAGCMRAGQNETLSHGEMPAASNRQNYYKKHCVTLSCIVSKKTVKLDCLVKENNELRDALEKFSSDEQKPGFSMDDLKILAKIPNESYADMTFVRVAIEKLYEGNSNILLRKSLNGRRARTFKRKSGEVLQKEQKDAMSPEKLTTIRSLFAKRVKSEGSRLGKFNKHVSNSLIKIQEKVNKNSKFNY